MASRLTAEHAPTADRVFASVARRADAAYLLTRDLRLARTNDGWM